MSVTKLSQHKPVTVQKIVQKKQSGQKITSLTCYDYTTAKILDETGLDFLLVGDSLAMTVLGHDDTLSLTLDEMVHHVKAVSRGANRALIVADMPFMTYHVSEEETVKNAGRLVQEGRAKAVKLEGAEPMTLSSIRRLVNLGIPVMGHLGFTPQSVNAMGGFKVQGKTAYDASKLLQDALALENTGVFAIVLEMVPVEVAQLITERLSIPTIGIGAGNVCDGQILVVDDILGRFQDLSPRFVRKYDTQGESTADAVTRYIEDVQSGAFPDNQKEAFAFPKDSLAQLEETLEERHPFIHELSGDDVIELG